MPNLIALIARVLVPVLSQFGWVIMVAAFSRFGQRAMRRIWRWFWA